jgi:hypothetical protein
MKEALQALVIASVALSSAPLMAKNDPLTDGDSDDDGAQVITVYGRALEQIGVAQTS